MTQLFTPIRVGRYALANRLVMAPMTRSRAALDGTPSVLAPTYYSQRASVGLIVTEGTQPSDDGQGYLTTPGIYTDAHVAAWQAVSSAVHASGGRLFIQLMHDRPTRRKSKVRHRLANFRGRQCARLRDGLHALRSGAPGAMADGATP
jgi:2,4-dienoyl-CoA reductase-like NADH-dependent reductase (Old Yellow Enzyme family)